MKFIKERIGKLLKDLSPLRYPQQQMFSGFEISVSQDKKNHVEEMADLDWSEMKASGMSYQREHYYYFRTQIMIPEVMQGQEVFFELHSGEMGGWDALNPQFLLYINGELRSGLDNHHTECLLTQKALCGETYDIVLRMYTGVSEYEFSLCSVLKVLDRRTEQYYYDLMVPYQAALLAEPEEKAYIDILSALNESLNLLDLRRPFSEGYYSSLEKAENWIQEEFYRKKCGNSEAVMYCVGHTHIDIAWLWTLEVTEDKVVRSFSTVLDLMKQYPEYVFMSSQPQLYQYVKDNSPELYEQIKERVKEGRWETDGGMYVEADCNLSSGEALVRQMLYGIRFFRQEFGQDNSILWLPDVFGYSAALPQIMKLCNLSYFMTTKISWSEYNKMPYDTFLWRGLDGSEVLTHFVPTRDYHASSVKGEPGAAYYTTYNGNINGEQVKGGWKRYSQKHMNQAILNSFGYGDGGGGPTKEMLENARRFSRGIPGCPVTVMSTAKNFFHDLEEQVKDNKYLPTWDGELYLEYHRGTYTSMARNKKYNRRAETAFQNLEALAVMDQELNQKPYPQEILNSSWIILLRNQFHDILPGSSIREVYEDSQEEYKVILERAAVMETDILSRIAENIDASADSLVVFCPSGSLEGDYITFEWGGEELPVIWTENGRMPVQRLDQHRVLAKVDAVPQMGYRTFPIEKEDPEINGRDCENAEMLPDAGSAGCLHASPSILENSLIRYELDEKGRISRIYDKELEREVLPQGKKANVLMTYEDRPHNYDAWDLNNYYVEKSWEVEQLVRIEVVEEGPVRAAVRLEKRYMDSVIVQYLSLGQDSRQLDMRHEIDWKEEHIFLKLLIPVDIHAGEASYEVQFGNVKRPTHYNTSWDAARFEVCMHKWVDLSEDGYGVSVLNDCKYGCSVHDGIIGISLLKSAAYPNPDADKEFHEFTISLLPHKDGWKQAHTAQAAYQLNNPLMCVVKRNDGGVLPAEYSMVTCPQENIRIETVKKAEEGESIVIRVYEYFNRRTNAILQFPSAVKKITECNLLEENTGEVSLDQNKAYLMVKPFEIKTFRVDF